MKSKIYPLSVIGLLKKEYPSAKIALNYSSPFQLLVATILSAQCTDDRVNRVTPALFSKYKNVNEFASAKASELESYVYSTGFFRNKAKNIRASAKSIVNNFGGEVPKTMDELLTLSGVARKTANIVLSEAFGVIEGIAVDTHVLRLSNRMGLSRNRVAEKVELDLMALIPRKQWSMFSHLMQAHGRKICSAKKPKCGRCLLRNNCPKIGVPQPDVQ